MRIPAAVIALTSPGVNLVLNPLRILVSRGASGDCSELVDWFEACLNATGCSLAQPYSILTSRVTAVVNIFNDRPTIGDTLPQPMIEHKKSILGQGIAQRIFCSLPALVRLTELHTERVVVVSPLQKPLAYQNGRRAPFRIHLTPGEAYSTFASNQCCSSSFC